MSNHKNSRLDEQALIEQLQQLPTSVESNDRWESILSAISEEPAVLEEHKKDASSATNALRTSWLRSIASIAAVLVVVITGVRWLEPSQSMLDTAYDKGFVLTAASLNHGNSIYYERLNMAPEISHYQNSALKALKDVRHASAHYKKALEQAPQDAELQQRLLNSLQKERKILRKLTA